MKGGIVYTTDGAAEVAHRQAEVARLFRPEPPDTDHGSMGQVQ